MPTLLRLIVGGASNWIHGKIIETENWALLSGHSSMIIKYNRGKFFPKIGKWAALRIKDRRVMMLLLLTIDMFSSLNICFTSLKNDSGH